MINCYENIRHVDFFELGCYGISSVVENEEEKREVALYGWGS